MSYAERLSAPGVRDVTERVRLPESLRAAAADFASGARTPVEPRDAATVVLLRDPPHPSGGVDPSPVPDRSRDIVVAGATTTSRHPSGGPEVYLLKRHGRMAFAAGMAVFPGGGVDDRDRDALFPDRAWTGPSAQQWAGRLGCDVPTARGLLCAAVRETFEESGVLLAGADPDNVVADTTGADWEADREALVAKEVSLVDVLARHRLVLRTDLLAAWTHWITPEFEPRRYDTRFFVAVLPRGQRTRDVSTESDAVAWTRPADAVAAVAAGRLGMMPPTVRTCEDMARLTRAADALAVAATRVIAPIVPRVVEDDDGLWLETVSPAVRR